MRSLGSFLRDAWHLAKPYFNSEEKWSARLLLASVIGLNLFMVALDVVLNFWNGLFYDALQNKNWTAFIDLLFWYQSGPDGLMPGFCVIAVIYILVAVYRTYLNQWLEIRWRRWLTSKFMEKWLADRAYYQISLTADPNGVGTDNPDQRIAEDLRSFVNNTLTLGIDLLSNIVSLFSFVGILWSLSGAVRLLGISIPGYMVWVALLYAVLGSWLTHLVGRPLAALNFRQQRFEANFRFSLVRLRENTEGVALYGGERQENAAITQRFGAVVLNWWSIMQRTKLLNALIAGYQQVAIVFPLIVAAPRYFSGQIALGGLMRTASAFGQVQGAMSWLVGAYSSLASWRATVERLATFEGAIKAARTAAACGISAAPSSTGGLELDNVALNLPNGAPLIARQTLSIPLHQSVLISGQSGAGKSTLFRALAGIWPFGSGTVQLPPGKSLFLPQRPYLPLGTLRQAIAYPAPATQFEDAAFVAALEDAGLEKLVGRLDQEDNWSLRLSGGEQQRLAIARALLLRPDWLFLDEATASLDPEAEMQLYRVLKDRLPGTGLISIAHRQALAAFHDRHLVLTPGREGEGAVLATAGGKAEAAPLQPIG
jgi:putative ATP-binding cassette transporter